MQSTNFDQNRKEVTCTDIVYKRGTFNYEEKDIHESSYGLRVSRIGKNLTDHTCYIMVSRGSTYVILDRHGYDRLTLRGRLTDRRCKWIATIFAV